MLIRKMCENTYNHSYEDTSRFTPLYVIRMFLEMKYYRNPHIIIPEAFLESDPTIEENLRRDLRNIDLIVESGDLNKIFKCMTNRWSFITTNKTIEHDCHKLSYAFQDFNFLSGCSRESVEFFLGQMNCPNIINCDVVRDLMPVNESIMNGDYSIRSVFDCIFRYILYTKTKHLGIFNKTKLNFNPVALNQDMMSDDFIFNY